METTKKGAHYFFLRSELADTSGCFDGAGQIVVDGVKLKVDFKSVTSTGSGGVIVVSPSRHKQWVRELYSHPLAIISDALLMAVAVPKGTQRAQASGVASHKQKRKRGGSGVPEGCEHEERGAMSSSSDS